RTARQRHLAAQRRLAHARVGRFANVPRAGARRLDREAVGEARFIDQAAKDAFGGRRSTDVSEADEQDTRHHCSRFSRVSGRSASPGVVRGAILLSCSAFGYPGDFLWRRSMLALSPGVFRGAAMSAATVALTLSLAACGQPPEAPEPAPVTAATPLLKNPLALQLWSMNASFAAEGVPATLATVKAMGISHVELAGTAGLSREDFK